jgi:hypothetical protein
LDESADACTRSELQGAFSCEDWKSAFIHFMVEKTMKKIFKKKIISDLPTLIFLRYETGTKGFFFYAL